MLVAAQPPNFSFLLRPVKDGPSWRARTHRKLAPSTVLPSPTPPHLSLHFASLQKLVGACTVLALELLDCKSKTKCSITQMHETLFS